MKRAREFGFEYTGIKTMTAQQQNTFRYQSKIVDEVFFKAFNQFCSALNLLAIDLNIYTSNMPESESKNPLKENIEIK